MNPEKFFVFENLPTEVKEVFFDPLNGTPDNITQAGCLRLANLGVEAWNGWREKFPTKTKLNGPRNNADFSGCKLDEYDFFGFNFGDCPNFSNAEFAALASFEHSTLGDFANFEGAKFVHGANFSDCTIGQSANFSSTTWGGNIFFNNTKTGRDTKFSHAQFFGKLSFEPKEPNNKNVFFGLDFSKAHFGDVVNFSYSEFKGKTSFRGASFSKCPLFHESELHQDISFDKAEFPPPIGCEESARAYRTLKFAFAKLQAVHEEQRFFRLEMQEEARREKGARKALFLAYEYFSWYGFSVFRPLGWAALTSFLFSVIYGLLSWVDSCLLPDVAYCKFAPEWISFSLLQMLPLPGMDKLTSNISEIFLPNQGWLQLILITAMVLHKLVMLSAIFFSGLALRNLFKLK